MDTQKPAATIQCWVELYTDSLFSWAFYKTGQKELSEDLVQDTFFSAVKSFEQFKGQSNPKTWLFSILNNKITDHYRKSFRNPASNPMIEEREDDNSFMGKIFDSNGLWKQGSRPQEWGEEDVHLLDDMDFKSVLSDCIDRLPTTWSAAIMFKYIEDKKSEIICQELEISASNYWQILHRAKLQLRQCIEINWFKNQKR